jgi:cytochrome c biogenesis protein CcdA
MIIKRNLLYVSFISLLLLLMSGTIGYISGKNIYSEFTSKKSNWSLVLLYLLGIYATFILLTLLVSYFKKTPTIQLSKSSIRFGNEEEIPLSEIVNINYTGSKSSALFLAGEGMAIEFKDKTKKVLLDELYTDLWQVKQSLYQSFTLKQEAQEFNIEPISTEEYQDENKTIFKGFVLFSAMGFLSYFSGLMYLFVVISVIFREGSVIWVIIIFGIFMFGTTSHGLHYFILTEKYLIIKNHNLFWKNDVHRLLDIKKISFEKRGKSPNFMRIITNDFKMRVYPADSLSRKDWKNLREDLLGKGVLVEGFVSFL